ncbi:MAG TPA: tetratricopeptide repeat protein, partial [Vicinamibacteria bacterium]
FVPGAEVPSSEVIRSPMSAPARSWVLCIGEDEAILERAASPFLVETLPILRLPPWPPLPLSVEELEAPAVEGPRVLYVPRIDRGFFDTPLSAASPLYLLPRLAQRASEGEPLSFIATAIESELAKRARAVLEQRGLASRFEIRRVAGTPHSPVEPAPSWEELEREAAARPAFHHLFRARHQKGPEAVATLREAVALAPQLPSAHYELGKALIQADDVNGAIAELRETVALLPEYASAWGNLGAALGEAQDAEGADEALRRALDLDPANAALHSNLGVACRDRGRLPEAETLFRRALELDPAFVFGHYNLAHTLFLAGRYVEAIDGFERAQSMDRKRSSRQALLLACARLASGDAAGAQRDYREVFERLPETARKDHRAVAEWDLKQLAQRTGVSPDLKETLGVVRSLAG